MDFKELIDTWGRIWEAYLSLWQGYWPIMIVAHLYILLQATWVHYLAVMNLSRNRNKLTPFARFWAYSVLAVGYPLDMLFNLIFGTIFFVEPPKELLFTGRCSRLIDEDDGWRRDLAKWFCRNMLDPFDPKGIHCR